MEFSFVQTGKAGETNRRGLGKREQPDEHHEHA